MDSNTTHPFLTRFPPGMKRSDVPAHELAAFDAAQAVAGVMSMTPPARARPSPVSPTRTVEMDKLLESVRAMR